VYTFKRKNQAVTLETKSSVKIGGDAVQIDPQLLFQRLTIAAMASYSLESVFKYERFIITASRTSEVSVG